LRAEREVVESDGECQHGLLGYLSFLFLSISRVLGTQGLFFCGMNTA
jgi:hypothetical protein